MKNVYISIALVFFSLGIPVRALGAADAEAILRAAEFIRNPQQDYKMKVVLRDKKKDKREVRSYECLIKGRNRAIVRFLTPEVDRGTKVLMVDNQMFVSTASAAKPVRISPKQRLAGNAAYGDVVRLNFLDNYTVKLLRTDQWQKRKAFVLELSAIEGRPVTYDRVEYWVDTENKRPLRALYQAASGKTLRESHFEGYKTVLGVNRPTQFLLIDYLEKDHVTTLEFTGTQKASLPELLFDKQNFARDAAS